ncbi:MAG: type II toxin-antitoxin system death-on-curing family toxin [Deltaproteobacteria bacterium]|nr:MAG: type II toxin-antitoxin system death-on-curing family toxin [Deltaproteobacteria bacterium]
MSDFPIFLTVDHVLAIHRRMIDEFGGAPEVRDYGLLESAVTMPAARYGGEFLHCGVPAMAASYLFHICKNHPFVDGNKRTAVAAAEIFLLINGMHLTATNEELEHLTIGVVEGTTSKDEVTAFFVKKVTGIV